VSRGYNAQRTRCVGRTRCNNSFSLYWEWPTVWTLPNELTPAPHFKRPSLSWPARAYSARPGEHVHSSNSLRSRFRSRQCICCEPIRRSCLGGKVHAHAHAHRFFGDATNCDKTVVETPRRRQTVSLIGVYVVATRTRHAHIACISTTRLWALYTDLERRRRSRYFTAGAQWYAAIFGNLDQVLLWIIALIKLHACPIETVLSQF